MVSEIYLTFLTTTVVAIIGLTIRVCYKSKCSEVEFCCIKIHRNTEQETDLPEPSPTNSTENNMRMENIYRL